MPFSGQIWYHQANERVTSPAGILQYCGTGSHSRIAGTTPNSTCEIPSTLIFRVYSQIDYIHHLFVSLNPFKQLISLGIAINVS